MLARHLEEVRVGGEEGVAVGQALATDQALADFVLPEDRALDVTFSDAHTALLGDEDAVVADHDGIHGIVGRVDFPACFALAIDLPDLALAVVVAVAAADEGEAEAALVHVESGHLQVRAVLLPPGLPGGAASEALVVRGGGQPHLRGLLTGNAHEVLLGQVRQRLRTGVQQRQQGRHRSLLLAGQQSPRGPETHARVGVVEQRLDARPGVR